MILIGQYDSPFVRRIGIALRLYGLRFEHRPWSSFSDAGLIRPYNPLTRVPTLVLDNGDSLVESHAMIDYLDGLVPEGLRLFPVAQPDRYQAMRIAGLATGVGDKAVSLFYEKRLHEEVSDLWVERCRQQITETLTVLEAGRIDRASEYWFGSSIGHADIAVAAVMRFVSEAHPGLMSAPEFPALFRACAKLESLPVFKDICQPFIPPAACAPGKS